MKEDKTSKIKLWISDIDGTLVNYDGSVTQRMKGLIEKINNSDIKLVLSTGRMYMGAHHAAKRFNITSPVVCYQGAMVRDNDKILWQAPLKDELVSEILEYLAENKIHTHLYSNDKLYVDDDNKKIMDEYCKGRGTVYEVADNLSDVEYNNVPKILCVTYDKSVMERLKKELSEKYKGVLTVVQSAKMYLEITDIKASKGNALNFLKSYWHLKDDEVLASGDQDNDIEMLKNAFYSVCVGHNSENLAKIAKYHCESVNSDELVDIVERLVLCE